jgi:hypothetical protein
MAKKAAKKEVKTVKTKPVSQYRLPSAWWISKRTAWLLWENRTLFIGLIGIYGLLNIMLVKGIAGGTDVSTLKAELNQVFTGNLGSVVSGLGVFALLLGGSGNSSNETAGAYQFFLTLIVSLAVIYILRHLTGKKNVGIKEAFYRGMYPLVPAVLLLLVVAVQLLPMVIGSGLYNLVISNGIAIHLFEKLIWLSVFVGLSAVSLYFITSSLFALYIVTLPEMTPIKALQSAKQLVAGRRLAVLRKLLWLPLLLLVVSAAIMLPIIILIAPLAEWIFFILTMVGLVVIHTYMYTLYRELLHE